MSCISLVYKIPYRRARAWPSAREQRYRAYKYFTRDSSIISKATGREIFYCEPQVLDVYQEEYGAKDCASKDSTDDKSNEEMKSLNEYLLLFLFYREESVLSSHKLLGEFTYDFSKILANFTPPPPPTISIERPPLMTSAFARPPISK